MADISMNVKHTFAKTAAILISAMSTNEGISIFCEHEHRKALQQFLQFNSNGKLRLKRA